MTSRRKWPVAIIGSGNGTDLMVKILRSEGPLSVGAQTWVRERQIRVR
jgi:acetaldehyde dehydrogenase